MPEKPTKGFEHLKYREGMVEAANDITTSEFAYWGALLTFNGIIIAVFSGVAVVKGNEHLSILLVILLSLASSVLLILNYRSRVNSDQQRAQLFLVERSQLEDFSNQLMKSEATARKRIRLRDNWVLALMTGEVILMLLLLLPI